MAIELQVAYELLGVKPGVQDADLRRAYRRKAMQLHPDRNPSPDAQSEFIRLQQAYEEILSHRQQPRRTGVPNSADPQQDRRRQEMERRRAAARKKREAYERSDLFKMHLALDVLAEHLSFILSISVFTVLPFFAFSNLGFSGLLGAMVILLISLPLTIPSIRNYPNLRWLTCLKAFRMIASKDEFIISTCSIFNIYVFCRVGLQTLIPMKLLILLNLLLMLVGFGVPRWLLKRFRKSTGRLAFGWAPTFVQAYFLLNFVFSANAVQQAHYFVLADVPWGKQTGYPVVLSLGEGVFREYPGMRFFWDDQKVLQKEKVIYTLQQGLFGWPIMTDYRFE